jgi:tetratricopeptide (TPR) repeat protein
MSRLLASGCVILALTRAAGAQTAGILAPLERTIAAAEESLRVDERQLAESRYRTALQQGWMIVGALEASDGRMAEARAAFERASASAVDNRAPLLAVAIVSLQLAEAESAIRILTRMTISAPHDVEIRRTLAQALIAAGKPLEAVQELEAAHAAAAENVELTFALASGYLRIKKVDDGERLMASVAAARPIPETFVLIGRTYRDFGYYERARAELRRALKMNPRIPRAHYYLAGTALMEEGVARIDEAISEFRQELEIAPNDPMATSRLAMALVEARRYEEALPLLDRTAQRDSSSADLWLYLGRCQLGLQRAPAAVSSFRRALELSGPQQKPADATREARLRTIYYQLGNALRQTGAASEADQAFAEAQRLSARRTDADREGLAQYMADARDSAAGPQPIVIDTSEIAPLTAAQRKEVDARVRATLARAYLNLGVMQAQADRPVRAAELLAQAADVSPAFPQVQYSLGVAYFNSQQYSAAAAALDRALATDPANADARRMLALASLNAEDYSKAAELLRDDPARSSNPSLQYAYGLALVRSGQQDAAEKIFSALLADHPDVAELNVVLGQAYAAQGDFEQAQQALHRALSTRRDVADANATLGEILLKQGKLSEAAEALRAELTGHPANVKARQTLATVLDLDGRSTEALAELRRLLASSPKYADARYLTGKILLARGAAAEAIVHLEAAVRLAPDVANTHYQLGQAYQRTGQGDLAAREFEIYQKLKDKRRGGGQ